MTHWRAGERLIPPAELRTRLDRIDEHLERVRESLHSLSNRAGVESFRVARLEADVKEVESSVETLSDVSHQLRGALVAMRLFTGGSLLAAAAATAALGRSLGWW